MTNYETYKNEINYCEDYKITIKDFVIWLKKENKVKDFFKAVHEEDVYTVAVDFSIPVIMVKIFQR